MSTASFLRDLDVSVFDRISSQTSPADRRSLLALQGAVSGRFPQYTYLEIGSFLGGSLQPHVLDANCARIFSIDTRCVDAPDDREQGCRIPYLDNSSSGMLQRLSDLAPRGAQKIKCFDRDASDVSCEEIDPPPCLAVIDGQHTHDAVISDFAFCQKVIAKEGSVAFHDSYIIYPAIEEICARLRREKRAFRFLKLRGSVSVISFDLALVARGRWIQSAREPNPARWRYFCAGQKIKKILPSPVFCFLKRALTPRRRIEA